MISKLNLVLVIIGLFAANIEADYIKSDMASQANLLDFMLQFRDLSNENPERSMECFSHFFPLLNQCSADYETNFKACETASDYSQNAIDESTKEDRVSLESSAKDSCEILLDCKKHERSLEFFECYENGGTQNSKTMYTISGKASDVLFNVREKRQVIQNDFYRCSNASERLYMEQTTEINDQMRDCLTGVKPIQTTTKAPPTEETTTKPPPEEGPEEGRKFEDADILQEESTRTQMSEKQLQRNSISKNVEKFKRQYKSNLQMKLGRF